LVLDSSALLAMLMDEPRAGALLAALVEADRPRLSVANWLEVAMLIEERGGRLASLRFDEFVRSAGIELMPVDAAQAEAARTAWRYFGRHKHSARLEAGDCYAYALAKGTGDNLLFVSEGFTRTDIEPALKEGG
jgi:ribonuclease VapC